jgi:hypothetical protein
MRKLAGIGASYQKIGACGSTGDKHGILNTEVSIKLGRCCPTDDQQH